MAVTNLVKRIQDIMRNDAGVDGDAQRISQMTWMFFLKVYDAKEEEWEFFDENLDKCNLTKLRYKGDDVMGNNASLLRIHGADEIMIFESSIYISPFYDKGIFVRNSTIKWSWTLVRKDGGQWEIISFGGG